MRYLPVANRSRFSPACLFFQRVFSLSHSFLSWVTVTRLTPSCALYSCAILSHACSFSLFAKFVDSLLSTMSRYPTTSVRHISRSSGVNINRLTAPAFSVSLLSKLRLASGVGALTLMIILSRDRGTRRNRRSSRHENETKLCSVARPETVL